jgi:hypothetical protein
MDELPSRAMKVLRLARPWDQCSDPGARARVRAGVALAVGAAPASAPANAGQPSATASLGGLKTKLALASTVLAVIGAGAVLKRSPPERAATPAAVVAPHVEPAPAEPAAPAATAISEPEQPSASSAPSREHARARDTLDAEVALLRQVDQAATRGDTERATRYLAQHHARFPSSVLAAEREGFDVLLRCLRRAPDSAQAARDFAARNPHAVLTRRVERACTPTTEQP